MKDYIYLISNNNGYVKVGISKNPHKRIKQIQTGNEHKLDLLFIEEFECARKHLLHVENAIHSKLKQISTNTHGEWFCIDDKKIDSIKNIITFYRIRYENDTISLDKQFR